MRKIIITALSLALAIGCSAQDPTKWIVVGASAQGAVNNDLETANVTNSGGILTITQTNSGSTCAHATTGGFLATKAFSFVYGVVKAGIKFGDNATNTIYSALWMWGGGPTSSGYPPTCITALGGANCTTGTQPMNACTNTSVTANEIDIAEIKNTSTAITQNTITWVSGVHTDVCHGIFSTGYPSGQYHVYELIRWPGIIIWRVDGLVTFTCTTNAFDGIPMFVILDSEGNQAGSLPSYPAHTSVDYVRVCSDPTNNSAEPACLSGDATTVFEDTF